jgi:N-acyl-D-aspartate/D-glutamate deacylase
VHTRFINKSLYKVLPKKVVWTSERYDVLVKNAKIVDGTGKTAFKGSIGIEGEKIAAVGNVRGDAAIVIDGAGLIACPGFVNPHDHGDGGFGDTFLTYPLCENHVMQGVTTIVGGNCGASLAPMKDYIFTPEIVARWWHEVDPTTYAPPVVLPLEKYRKILEEKLGYALDWRTFGEFLSKVEKTRISVNYVPLVGHNAVRIAVMEMDFQRKAKPSEIEEMKKHVDEAMRSGAHGFSVNLDGIPGCGDFASTEEVIELAKVAQKYGGLYTTHMRNADNNYPTDKPEEYGYGICHNISVEEMPVSKYYALLEAIEVCRKANIPTQLSHVMNIYLIYQYFPDYLQEACAKAMLEIIDKAREEGLEINFDVMPDWDIHELMLSATELTGLFMKWLKRFGSKERLVENLKMKDFRDELRKVIMGGRFKINMIHPKTDPFWMDRVYIVSSKNKAYERKTINEIARLKHTDPIDTIFDIIIEDPNATFNCTDIRWTEAIVRTWLKHPASMVGFDIWGVPPFTEPPLATWTGGTHGLGLYAGYPRYIRKFVKEKAIFTLEEAIKKATYLPAQKFRLKDRGVISPGAYADILLFDFEKIREKGTQLNPRQAPEGIAHVLVNGKVVYENMAHTGARPGKVIRHIY